MKSFPSCLRLEYPQPVDAIETERVEAHSARLYDVHLTWSEKIRDCGQKGLLSVKATRTAGMHLNEECVYLSPEVENISNLRCWGMGLNDICAIESELSKYDSCGSYLALFTERHVDSNLVHFSLFDVDHATGIQVLVFHRSNCDGAQTTSGRSLKWSDHGFVGKG